MNNSLQMEPARPEVPGTLRRAPSAGQGGPGPRAPQPALVHVPLAAFSARDQSWDEARTWHPLFNMRAGCLRRAIQY